MIQNDSTPLFSESHPQWLTVKGDSSNIEVGDVLRVLWKCYARKAKPMEDKICVVKQVSRLEDGTVLILPFYPPKNVEYRAISGSGSI